MFLTPQKDCRRQRTSAVPNLLKLNPVAFISRLKAVNSAIGVGGGVSLIKHVSQRDGRRDEWQSLHPVIHTESFEVKPEGRRADRLEQRRWFQASQKGLQRRKVWAAAKHTQVGDENTHTHTCNHADFPHTINGLVILNFHKVKSITQQTEWDTRFQASSFKVQTPPPPPPSYPNILFKNTPRTGNI